MLIGFIRSEKYVVNLATTFVMTIVSLLVSGKHIMVLIIQILIHIALEQKLRYNWLLFGTVVGVKIEYSIQHYNNISKIMNDYFTVSKNRFHLLNSYFLYSFIAIIAINHYFEFADFKMIIILKIKTFKDFKSFLPFMF